ncbi:NAD(P)/FAD-dependent oxidoreductase [Imperialibacter roseus]|uniref:NADH:ubiquinone reductase (non-electrogenic) n=1 Tax=Imperialibacter roseus TaxID=1324217 RepID=A0ABZ0ITI6_9BACT|nr:NAD(P)/FAD-dependent oxidoreductase [Imperialibacter roseus]WOK08342.1 NAD(P)/FAD-dependent oxidoreductase [Imperialibacter roseus]
MELKTNSKKQVVVIGGGFAGLNFITRLEKSPDFHITLVDKNNYNYFTPLLYQVATGFLEPASISYPFRKLFKGYEISFRLGEVETVDPALNKVYLTGGQELSYDVLVFAAGAQPNFFGNESVMKNAITLNGIGEALFMRNQLIKVLELAASEKDPIEKRKLLTLVIAGGGPTGVEVAGMLAEMKSSLLLQEYSEIKDESIEIYLVDGADSLLAPMSTKTHKEALRILEGIGVNVKLNTLVTQFENGRVQLSNGQTIAAGTLIWAAGVVANTFEGITKSSLGHGNRMVTDSFNRVKGYHNIYAIGDISIQHGDLNYPDGHPQLAQPAIQQGKRLASNLVLMAKGKPMAPFDYFDRGEMAIIGRKFALVDLFKHKVHIGGILGLLSWLFIHLLSLVNYNNIIKTMYGWGMAYLTRDQPLRMIIKPEKRGESINVTDNLLKSRQTYLVEN